MLCFLPCSGFLCFTETQKKLDMANTAMRLQLEVNKAATEAGLLMLKQIQAVRTELAEEHRAALYLLQQLTESHAHAADLEGQLKIAKLEMATVQARAAILEEQLAAARTGPVATVEAHATVTGQQPASAH
jgi:DNA repair exonuclease SbcCD ATPase subunit